MLAVVDCTVLMLEIQSIKEYSYALYKRNIKEKQNMGISLHWARYINALWLITRLTISKRSLMDWLIEHLHLQELQHMALFCW